MANTGKHQEIAMNTLSRELPECYQTRRCLSSACRMLQAAGSMRQNKTSATGAEIDRLGLVRRLAAGLLGRQKI